MNAADVVGFGDVFTSNLLLLRVFLTGRIDLFRSNAVLTFHFNFFKSSFGVCVRDRVTRPGTSVCTFSSYGRTSFFAYFLLSIMRQIRRYWSSNGSPSNWSCFYQLRLLSASFVQLKLSLSRIYIRCGTKTGVTGVSLCRGGSMGAVRPYRKNANVQYPLKKKDKYHF